MTTKIEISDEAKRKFKELGLDAESIINKTLKEISDSNAYAVELEQEAKEKISQ